MSKKEEELDRIFDMVTEGFLPKPLRVLIVLFSLFYGPLLALLDKILERSSRE